MDYSNFVRNFFRKATSALQNYYQYNGKIVELSFDLDIPSEFRHEETQVNMFLPSSMPNINAPTKYFIDFMDYYIKSLPNLGVVYANSERINAMYNVVVDLGISDNDEKVLDYMDFIIGVGINVLVQQGVLEN